MRGLCNSIEQWRLRQLVVCRPHPWQDGRAGRQCLLRL